MLRNLFTLLGVLMALSLLQSQNTPEYFKVFPVTLSEATPEWAVKMYQADPIVPEVEYLYHKFWKNTPFVKDIHVRNYQYWRRKVEPWINEEGRIRKPDPSVEEQLNLLLKQQKMAGRVSLRTTETPWESIGPFETYMPENNRPVSWQVNVYCVHAFPGNTQLLLAGTEGGGAFISENKGLEWRPCTQETDISSVTAVQIHPGFANIMLMGGNRRIFRSTDQADTWSEVLFLDGEVNQLFFHPGSPEIAFAATSKGLYRSTNGGVLWNLVFPQACWDIKVHPTNPTIWYALAKSADNRQSLFLRSLNDGLSWDTMTDGWYTPEDPGHARDFGGKIAVSKADPDRVYAALIGEGKPGDDGWIGIYRSDDQGNSWALPAGQTGGPYQSPNTMPWNVAAYSDGYHQGFYNFALGVSSTDADRIWIGSIRLTESRDGGRTFQAIGAANSQRHNYIHADIQDIHIHNEEIWVASDGGLDFSTDELMSHESRKYGISGSDFWGFDVGWNLGTMVGGKYHNGNSAFQSRYGKGNYLHIGGVEEPTGYINPVDNAIVYTNQWWAGRTRVQRIPETIDGSVAELAALPIIPNESYIESSSSGIYFDPRYANRMFVGKDNAIWRSTDGGQNFENLHAFGSGEVHQIVISHSQPDILYLVFHEEGFWSPCQLHKSTDGGLTWTRLADIPADRWRLIVEVHPTNPSEIWVASSRGANGQKLFYSQDGGITWVNKSSPLMNNQQIRSLSLVPVEGADLVFIATNRSVLRLTNQDPVLVEDYSEGLPLYQINTLKIKPYYSGNNAENNPALQLLLPTYGRGIYSRVIDELAIEPVIQIASMADTVFCSRDTVQLESVSILGKGVANEWKWSINPAPDFVDDDSKRNPKVVFGNAGVYSISINVTASQGSVLSRSFPDFIHVDNQCEPDGLAGQAFSAQTSGDFVQLTGPEWQTNTFTLSAWVFPDGIQPDYSAVYMNDGETAGLNFLGGNNTLGYHWPGGAWWWNSGLQVPANQWSHVAMVASPDGIDVYVNGLRSRHTFAVSPVRMGSAKLGSYKGWSSRNFTGKMDEVSVWNRSMTRDDIRKIRHLTLTGQEEDLVAYYSFNESDSRVFDNKGTRHGYAQGSSQKLPSTAPVAAGKSQLIKQNADQAWVFDSLALQIEPGVYSPIAAAEWVAFDLEPPVAQADSIPFQAYWILNEYTSESPAAETASIRFLDLAENGLERAELYFAPLTVEANPEERWAGSQTQEEGDLVFQQEDIRLREGKYGLIWEQSTSTWENKPIPDALSVFPNPVIRNQELMLTWNSPFSGTLRLVNLQGRTLQVHSCSAATSLTLPLNGISPGTYILWYENEHRMGKRLFIVH
jgi:photosystem II stability/assembly factor-like uncharacterized protein